MTEPAPGHVSYVQQAIHAVEIDKSAEVGDVFHGAADAVATFRLP